MNTKVCSRCKEEKSVSEFHKRSKAIDGLQGQCKKCNIDARKEAYRTNKHGNMDKTKNRTLQAKIRNRDYVISVLKQHSCVDCGTNDIVVLQFDHLRDKKYNIADMIRGSYSVATIQSEIDKCEIVCANCHTRRTASRGGWFKLT